MNATDILGQLLGAGQKGSGSLNTSAGAKVLEDLLGVGTGAGGNTNTGGGVFGGGLTGGGTSGGNAGGTVGQQNTGTTSGGGLGDLLGKALKELGGGGSQPAPAGSNNPFGQASQQSPQISQNEKSAIYIRAMIQAGLADGRIDEQEQQAILQRVGKVGAAEEKFIRGEIAKGLDINGFIHSVPRGMEEEVYAVSLTAIQLDNRTEAQFLDAIAKGLRITQDQSNTIHDKFKVQRLYN